MKYLKFYYIIHKLLHLRRYIREQRSIPLYHLVNCNVSSCIVYTLRPAFSTSKSKGWDRFSSDGGSLVKWYIATMIAVATTLPRGNPFAVCFIVIVIVIDDQIIYHPSIPWPFFSKCSIILSSIIAHYNHIILYKLN